MTISEQIKKAKPEEMSDIILALNRRYNELFPEWDLNIFTLEKAVDKNQQIDDIIALLERMKEN